MQVSRTIQELRAVLRAPRHEGRSIGFVPTMGALHEGHLSLVRLSRKGCDVTVVSIFVNPLQFAANEDLGKYPRTFESDCAMLEKAGVDFLFAPPPEEMYTPGATTFVTVEGTTDRLDGVSRPGHFRGVTTVVAKLFHIVQPDRAFFGQKDSAQAAIVRQMVHDLNFPLEIVIGPIVREPDGLAMSSRNTYLNPAERQQSLVLSRTLREIEKRFAKGERNAEKLIAAGSSILTQDPGTRLDYLSIVHPDTLEPVATITAPTLVAIAAWVGATRLIDNLVLDPNARR
jgi:pantoate--beta-alanine ligase